MRPADEIRRANGRGDATRARPFDASPRQRWLALASRHRLAVALLAAGLALRVLAAAAYRPALFYIDTVRYLYNAEGMDPVGYKAPLRAILAVSNFDAVAAIQHLLGLAVALLIYVLLLRRGLPRWLAALAMAPILLDAYQIQTEQSVMPGVWFEALITAGLAVLLWRQPLRWPRAVAGGVVLGASATFAQVGEAMLVPAVIFVLASAGGWWRAVGRAAALTAAFALPILLYCAGSYLLTGDFFLSHTGATSMYGRMAAAADCASLRLPAAERGMCPTMTQQAHGPDWLEYAAGSPIRPYYSNLPRATTDRMISDFNRRVAAQQPLRVLGAYGRDVVKLFALTRAGSPGDTPISRWQFQTSYPYYQHATPQIVRAATLRYGGGPPSVWRPGARLLRSYQLDGGYTSGPLLALLALCGLAGSAVAVAGPALSRRRARAARAEAETRPLALACLLFFVSAVSVLLVSDLFEFSWRYQLPALVTLVPAGALGIGVILRAVNDRRPDAGSPAGAVRGRARGPVPSARTPAGSRGRRAAPADRNLGE